MYPYCIFNKGYWVTAQIGAQFGQINNNCDQIGSNVQDNSSNTASDDGATTTTTTTTTEAPTFSPFDSRQQSNSLEQ